MLVIDGRAARLHLKYVCTFILRTLSVVCSADVENKTKEITRLDCRHYRVTVFRRQQIKNQNLWPLRLSQGELNV